MTITETELRDTLAQLASAVSGGVHFDKLERRIKRRGQVRRFSLVGVVAATAAIAVAVPLVTQGQTADRSVVRSNRQDITAASSTPGQPSAAPTTHQIPVTASMPDYWHGHRLLEQRAYRYEKVRPGREQVIELTYTPTIAFVGFAVRCDADPRVAYGIKLDGQELAAVNCSRRRPNGPTLWGAGTEGGGDVSPEYACLTEPCLKPGRIARITITLVYDADASPRMKTADYDVATAPRNLLGTGPGELGIGFYVPVGWKDYRFPPRPAEFEPFSERGIGGPVLHRFTATEPAGTNGMFSAKVQSATGLCVFGSLVGPGRVKVLVDGVLVARATAWDWAGGDENGFGGDRATASGSLEIEVVATGFTAPAWQVSVYECAGRTVDH